MFNRKISKKIAGSQGEHEEERFRLREMEMEKLGLISRPSKSLKGNHIPLNTGRSRSRSRIAAGFDDVSSGQRVPSGNRSRSQGSRSSDDEVVLPASADELHEEYDPDSEEIQYPRQGYPTAEMLLEEYGELIEDSVDDIREVERTLTRAPISRQPSRLQGELPRSEDKVSKNPKKSAENLSKRPSGFKNSEARNTIANDDQENYHEPENDSPVETGADDTESNYASRSNSALDQSYSRERVSSRSSSRSGGNSRDRERDSKIRDPSRCSEVRGLERESKGRGRSRESKSRSRERSEHSRESDRGSSTKVKDPGSSRDLEREKSRKSTTDSKLKIKSSGCNVLESASSRLGSIVSSVANMGSSLGSSSNRLANNTSAASNNAGSLVFRDVAPLPIEIPDTVTDEDAFRRYLSVRRRALPYLFDDDDDDAAADVADDANDNERSTVESLGRTTSSPAPYPRTPSKIDSREMLGPSVVSFQAPDPYFGYSQPSQLHQSPLSSPVPQCSAPCCASSANNNNNTNQNYQRKSASLSHAIMTLALLSASAAQLRFVVAYSHAHAYPTLNYFLICSCIVIEILVGIGFVVLARFDFSDAFQDKLHSYLIFGLFVVTIANVIVAAFALDDHICEVLVKRSLNSQAALTERQMALDGGSQNLQQTINQYNT